MTRGITFCLLVVGLINFLPLLGLFSAQKLQSAYDIELISNDLIILMRHRALLFGILGGFVLYASFVPKYQTVAMIMAGISMIGFALLVLTTGGYNEAIGKVLLVDYVGILFLLVTIALRYVSSRSKGEA